MWTTATKLTTAFYHDDISDDKLEYFASGGGGQGKLFQTSNFCLDIQKYIQGHPGHWILAVQVNKRTSRKTLSSIKRIGGTGNKISGHATPVLAQVLVPDPVVNINAQHIRSALDAFMEGGVFGVVHNVKLLAGGTYTIKHHRLYLATQQKDASTTSTSGGKKGKVVKGSKN